MFFASSVDYEYQAYEKQSGSPYNRRTITGKTVGCSKCVGYCRYDGHPGFLTGELRKAHDCCKKGCAYYVPKPKKAQRMNEMQEDMYGKQRTQYEEYQWWIYAL